jgi:hypothetical protein
VCLCVCVCVCACVARRPMRVVGPLVVNASSYSSSYLITVARLAL